MTTPPLVSSMTPNPRELPSSVKNLLHCARFEIEQLEREQLQRLQRRRRLRQENSSPVGGDDGSNNNPGNVDSIVVVAGDDDDDDHDVEDALDDGFMCIDLNVISSKLSKWQELFPNVTPYFAMKCHPDPNLVQWFGSFLPSVGYDCASLAELQLAKRVVDDASSRAAAMDHNTVPRNDGSLCLRRRRGIFGNHNIVYANPQRAENDLLECMKLFAATTTGTTSTTNNNNDNNSGTTTKTLPELSLKPRSLSCLWLTLDGMEELYKIDAARRKLMQQQQQIQDTTTTATGHQQQQHQQQQLLQIQLIIRIFVPDKESQVPLGEKFGIGLDQIQELTRLAMKLGNLPIIGVSFHCGSGCHDPQTYAAALRLAKQAMGLIDNEQQQQVTTTSGGGDDGVGSSSRCWLLDIGGGFPGWDGLGGDYGRFEGGHQDPLLEEEDTGVTNDTALEISRVILPMLQNFQKEGITIIAEPGRYFVEACAMLVSRIYKVTTTTTQPRSEDHNHNGKSSIVREYRIPHGVQGVFKDVILCGESFVPQTWKTTTSCCYKSRVVGPDGIVIVEDCELPELSVGDWLVFDRMGAYTLSIASRAGRPVVRYVLGQSRVVKKP